MKTYTITKKFIGGLFDGLSVTEVTRAEFKVGQTYGGPYGSRYVITSIKEEPWWVYDLFVAA